MNRLLYEDIVEKIEEQIYNGELKDGEKLPSERELAAEHAVSRNVIREAIGTLREKGFIVVKQGKGAYVTNWKSGIVTETLQRMLRADDSTGDDVLEVRESLETAILDKAVQKVSERDIEKLKNIYEAMEASKSNVNRFVEKDAEFHLALAESTQNRIFPLLIQSFHDMTEGSIFALTRFTPYSVEDAQKHHGDLIRALETGNAQLAVSTIQCHLDLLRSEVEQLKKRRHFK